jgi:hypothetical protein
MIDAEVLLRSVIGEPLSTLRGKPNTVLSVDSGHAHVATSRSQQGSPVPVAWLQDVLDRLAAGDTVSAEATSGAFRSAFLRAALGVVPQVEILDTTSPPTIRVDP